MTTCRPLLTPATTRPTRRVDTGVKRRLPRRVSAKGSFAWVGRAVPALWCLFATGPAVRAADASEIWRGALWGDPSQALIERFGGRATLLPRPIDFGDSYAQVVLRDVRVGGVALTAFFQMDKANGGLKRIQLERHRHGVTPAAFRAVAAALDAAYGAPDAVCGAAAGPANGYQGAAEQMWRRGSVSIRAVFRDTTIEAFEGCLEGDPSLGPCGLTGQLLVRISPPGTDAASCAAPRRTP